LFLDSIGRGVDGGHGLVWSRCGITSRDDTRATVAFSGKYPGIEC